MSASLSSLRLPTLEFKQQVVLRLQQLAARQEAQAYARVLTVLHQNATALLPATAA